MSALTDLFTALANKIRSKTGGSDTYTPPEMVAAIDDVYDAGVAAGTTPTQSKTVTAGTSATTVTPDQGYALSSVTINPTPTQSKTVSPGANAQTVNPDAGYHLSSVTVNGILTQTKISRPNVSTNKTIQPDSGYLLDGVVIQPLIHSDTYTPAVDTAANDMGEYHDIRYVNTSGMIIPSGNKAITANGSGIDVKSFSTVSVNVPSPTINSITPSNTSPAAMSSGNNYSPTAAGYAISSYSSVTPSSSGAAFSSGMVKMDGNGYAYSSRPTVKKSTSTLWTNSAPSSEFAGNTTITLSSSMTAYDYLIIRFKYSTTGASEWDVNVNVNDFINNYMQSGGSSGAMASVCWNTGTYVFYRPFTRKSNTQINFSACRRTTSSAITTVNTGMIPISVKGVYYYV